MRRPPLVVPDTATGKYDWLIPIPAGLDAGDSKKRAVSLRLTALIQFCALVYSLFDDFDATAVGHGKIQPVNYRILVNV